jgi:hypothetical protein
MALSVIAVLPVSSIRPPRYKKAIDCLFVLALLALWSLFASQQLYTAVYIYSAFPLYFWWQTIRRSGGSIYSQISLIGSMGPLMRKAIVAGAVVTASLQAMVVCNFNGSKITIRSLNPSAAWLWSWTSLDLERWLCDSGGCMASHIVATGHIFDSKRLVCSLVNSLHDQRNFPAITCSYGAICSDNVRHYIKSSFNIPLDIIAEFWVHF